MPPAPSSPPRRGGGPAPPRSRPRPLRGERAEGGTLGLLFFGATVLTGALIFAMFVGTSEKLSDEARDVADGATGELAPVVQVRSIVAERDRSSNALGALQVYLALAPGSRSLDLRTLAVEVSVPGASQVFRQGPPPEGFRWSAVVDAPPLLDPEAPLLSRGDTVAVRLDLVGADLRLPPRSQGAVLILAPEGRAVRIPLEVPAAFPSDVLELHGAGPGAARRWTLHRFEEPCAC